jgi:hypothetical protein
VVLGPAGESGLANLGLPARDKTGERPIPPLAHGSPADRRRVAGEGAARELAPKVRVPIWCIGSRGAHRGRLAVAKQIGDGEPATVGRSLW